MLLSSFKHQEFLEIVQSLKGFRLEEFVVEDKLTYDSMIQWIRSTRPIVEAIRMLNDPNEITAKQSAHGISIRAYDAAQREIFISPISMSVDNKDATMELLVLDNHGRRMVVQVFLANRNRVKTIQVGISMQSMLENPHPDIQFDDIEDVESMLMGVPITASETDFDSSQDTAALVSAAGAALLATYLQEICRPTRYSIKAGRTIKDQSIPAAATGILLMALELHAYAREVVSRMHLEKETISTEVEMSERDRSLVDRSNKEGKLSQENFLVPGSNLIN